MDFLIDFTGFWAFLEGFTGFHMTFPALFHPFHDFRSINPTSQERAGEGESAVCGRDRRPEPAMACLNPFDTYS